MRPFSSKKTWKLIGLPFLAALICAACASDGEQPATDAAPTADTHVPTKITFGGKRPVTLEVPADYDHAKKYPLVLVLHGYSANGWTQERLFGYHKLVDDKGVLVAAPDGTVDKDNNQFWNATDACCDRQNTKVDDVAYLTGVIKEIKAEYNVDPGRVYLIGHSNGGFMSFRMACDAADQVAAIVSLAGATWSDSSRCKPSKAVSVLAIHGDQDTAVLIDGGTKKLLGKTVTYPGAKKSLKLWAGYNKCTGKLGKVEKTLDLDSLTAGSETEVQRHAGCPKGVDVELWTMKNAGHLPVPTAVLTTAPRAWLEAPPPK